MSTPVKSLIIDAPVVHPDMTGSEAFEMFQNEPDLLVCGIVYNGKPLGLLSRNILNLKMADTHGRAVYSKRPVTLVMDKNPLMIEADRDISEISQEIISEGSSALLEGFIITQNGKFSGVGSGIRLIKLLHRQSKDRNRKLVSLAEQLGRARIDALSAAQAKSEFLATMSHEIRTPLNGVLGVAQLLIASGLDPERQKLAETIQNSGEILLRILNDILDLSKIEAGKMDLEAEDFAIEEIARDTRQLWQARASEKSLDFEVSVINPDKVKVTGDAIRLKQVLFNMIGNAIKFTTKGKVGIELQLIQIAPGRTAIRAEVTDTGCGVPDNAKEKLFNSFTQGDGAVSRKFGGTGLGLTICKRIVDLMDGTIGFESEEGRGSTFWFEAVMPIAESAPVEETGPDEVETIDLQTITPSILLAEDNPINQEVIKGFLKLRGWNCEVVEDGQAAIDAIKSQPYDLLLMDIQMPRMDGVEATRHIRKLKAPLCDVPIIALTANAMRGDEKICLDAGMDGYAAKPINKQAFFDEIDRLLKLQHNEQKLEQASGSVA